jgi:hypothetical protein
MEDYTEHDILNGVRVYHVELAHHHFRYNMPSETAWQSLVEAVESSMELPADGWKAIVASDFANFYRWDVYMDYVLARENGRWVFEAYCYTEDDVAPTIEHNIIDNEGIPSLIA